MSQMDWEKNRRERAATFELAGIGAIRAALLFGSGAVALALLLAPIADSTTRSASLGAGLPAGIDLMTTGSIGHRGAYTIRKSVLQPSPNSECIIRANGMRSGEC